MSLESVHYLKSKVHIPEMSHDIAVRLKPLMGQLPSPDNVIP